MENKTTFSNLGVSPLLAVRDLYVQLGGRHNPTKILRGVNLEIGRGEIVGLVGESGSGKTLTSLSVLQLLPKGLKISGGSIEFDGKNLLALSLRELQSLRGGRIAMIFQDPLRHLNPVFTVGEQLEAVIRTHGGKKMTAREVRQRAIELLDQVKIRDPEARLRSYPHQFSGGMAQRVMIAMALSSSPELLMADEPTSALDVTVQAEILRLLRSIAREKGMSVLFVSHNLAAVWQLCDRVCVMYAGQVVEMAPTEALIADPAHPYSRALLAALPTLTLKRHTLANIPGATPAAADFPSGCAFHPRCVYAQAECAEVNPPALTMNPGHLASCLLAGQLPTQTESAA